MMERVLLQLYTLLLRLYPRQFQQDFAAEMQTVFGDALGAARRNSLWAMLGLCSREAGTLPRALVREYWQTGREKEAGMDKNMRFTANPEVAGSTIGRQAPVHGWGDVLLAALPFLLILLIDIVPKLLVEAGVIDPKAPAMQLLNTVLGILLIGVSLLILFLAWRREWPDWSASWYLFFLLPLPLLAGWLLGVLLNLESTQEIVFYLFLPLTLAVLLYAVTRLDRLRGLLAALPVLYFLWWPNMEFVPVPIEIVIKAASTALIYLAIAFLLRRGDWRSGLYAVLAMNLAVGILFSYVGIYHGGMLPFVAPGPNLVETARSLIPQFLATSAILLGPLFAWKFRQVGRSGGRTGPAGYHIALAGLLLVILANLSGLMNGMSPPYSIFAFFNSTVLTVEILLGLGVYLFGLFWLYRGTRFVDGEPGWTQLVLLALLPLAIPVAFILPFITWRWPISDLYGIPLLWALPQAISLSLGLVWLALSVWVVTQGAAGPSTALGEESKAPVLS